LGIKVKEKGGALQITGIVFLVLAVVIWLGWRPVTEELSTLLDLDNASRSRPDAAISTLKMHEDYSLLGSGFGSFKHVFPSYQAPSIQSGRWTHAHNDYVELLANGGIVGVIIILGVIVSFFWEFKRVYPHIPNRSKFLIGGASTGLGAAFLHSFIGFGFRSPASALLFMTIVGLCIASTRLRSRKSGHKKERKGDLEFIPGSREGVAILRGAAILGFFSVLAILWICISDFRGAMAYSRVHLYKMAAEKATTAEYFNLQTASGLKDTEILLQHGSGIPDNLREASKVCLNWAADDRIRNLNMQFQLIERSAALSATALQSAPSDYLIWKQLARAQAALGLPEKARIALHRARELAPPGKVVEFPSLTSK
jgi:hypothetical protein